MSDTKISALASGAPAQSSDIFPIARAGANFGLTLDEVLIGAPCFFDWQANIAATVYSVPACYQGWIVPTSSPGGTLSSVAATNTAPTGIKATTSATPTSSAGGNWQSSGNDVCCPFQLFRGVRWTAKLSQTANMRIWMGWTDHVNEQGASYQSDTPTINFVGFRYSTAAGDTKYQCVTQTSNVASTKNPETTATHVDTNVHAFAIRWDDTSVYFYIDGALVGTQNTNLPASSQLMGFAFFIDNVGLGNAQAFTLYNFGGIGKF